ncbi:MAG: hypothetical protein HDT08_04470 [Bacteroidales bacterium]|nr:hypothetical protein [Bacteroidales bacterium]
MSVQGISFYDFLGKFIPGALLLLLFNSNTPTFKLDSPEIVIWLAAAYLLGIIWDRIVRCVFKKLRRCPYMIRLSLKKQICQIRKNNDGKYPNPLISNIPTKDDILYYYDEAYSLLMIKNMLGTVPKQETHENFLKNIAAILFVLLLKLIFCNDKFKSGGISSFLDCLGLCKYCNCGIFCIIVVAIAVVALVWYKTQMSVYETVWDNAYWIRYHISKKEENKQ